MIRYILVYAILTLVMGSSAGAESLWNDKAAYLFSDTKAYEVGDNITVIISEASSAYQKAGTKLDNQSDLSVGPGTGLLKFGKGAIANTAKESDQFQGNGSTERSGKLSGTVTAQITKVLDNGEFQIKGSKELVINSETQKITVEGTIREKDINADNTIYSTYISDAKITFSGTGPVGDSQDPGIVTKLFAWLF